MQTHINYLNIKGMNLKEHTFIEKEKEKRESMDCFLSMAWTK